MSQLVDKAEQHDNESDGEKWYPLGGNENQNDDENSREKWYPLGGKVEQYNNEEDDEDYSSELLKTVKTIHITSYEDVLGDIDVCRFDTLRDMRNTMETWDGEDLYWPAGFRFYVNGEKVERDDEDKWSVMRLPTVVDVKINEDYSRRKSESCDMSIERNEINGDKRMREEKIGDDKESTSDTSPTKKKKSSSQCNVKTDTQITEEV